LTIAITTRNQLTIPMLVDRLMAQLTNIPHFET
jgi:hypothetical protein